MATVPDPETRPEIETINDCAVGGMSGDRIYIGLFNVVLPRDQALRLAAWIIALCDDGRFGAVLEAIKRT